MAYIMSKRPLTKTLTSSRAKKLNIYQDALSMNAYFLLQTSNNLILYSFLTVTILDSNRNHMKLKSMSKTIQFVYMCNFRMSSNDL